MRPPIAPLLVVLTAAALALTACQPEPSSSAAPTAAPTTSSSATASADPSPSASSAPVALPDSCEQLYSAGMLTTLQAQPLNDPGVTLESTQIVAGLEVLGAGVPSIRCSWGAAGAAGLVTTVAVVSADQSTAVLEGLRQAGLGCEDQDGGTLCAGKEEVLTQDDTLVTRGETHFLRGTTWIATSYVDLDPDGYTQDIAATLRG